MNQSVIALIAVLVFACPLTFSDDDVFHVKFLHGGAGTGLVLPDNSSDLRNIRGKHELRLSWEVACNDATSLYCYYQNHFSVESADENGMPFVRTKPPEQLPPYNVKWLGGIQEADRTVERFGKDQKFGVQLQCDRLPSEIQLLNINIPVWKATIIELVTVPITEDRVWQELPNGSRVMLVIEDERGKYDRVALYREHSFSTDRKIVPPPCHLIAYQESNGDEMAMGYYFSSKGALIPDNPAEADFKRIAFIRQRYDPAQGVPTAAVIAVVHQYEPIELNIRIESMPLGNAVPVDQIAP